MGLLDKAGEMQGEESKPKKVVKKAAPKATPKPAAAKPKKVKTPKAKKSRTPVDRSLPDEFMVAGRGNRAAAMFINFLWNWGAIVGGVVLNVVGNAQITAILVVGLIMAVMNIIVIPTKWGRNIGQFASRTKYIRYTGKKPFFLHGILANTDTLFFLLGLWMAVAMSGLGAAGTGSTDWAMVSFGILFLAVPITNYFFKKYTDNNMTLWDFAFGAYLVTHTPTGEETGWAARFEKMGDFVEKRQERATKKKAEKEAKSSESSEDEDKDESENED